MCICRYENNGLSLIFAMASQRFGWLMPFQQCTRCLVIKCLSSRASIEVDLFLLESSDFRIVSEEGLPSKVRNSVEPKTHLGRCKRGHVLGLLGAVPKGNF